MPVPGYDALLGLDSRYDLRIKETLTSCLSSFRRFHLDAADFEHSTFFDNSSHGVGGWGDPENDFQIYTGGFKDVIRAYPNPHHIRRNFTLFPFQMPPFPGAPLSSDPSAPPPPVDLMINTTFTQANVDYTVNNFTGDFIGFQEYTEGLNAS